jgi:Bacterial protein of unknown function (DUF922)
MYERPIGVDEVDENLTLEECVPIRNGVSNDLHEIVRAIDSIISQIEWSETQNSPTPEERAWRVRANDALRHLRRHRQDYSHALTHLNRRVRQLRNGDTCRAYDRAFVVRARALLEKHVYERIRDDVNAELSTKIEAAA